MRTTTVVAVDARDAAAIRRGACLAFDARRLNPLLDARRGAWFDTRLGAAPR
jgi:hypothetical protein